MPAVESVPEELGTIRAAVADTGYYSDKNVEAVQGMRKGQGNEKGIEPIIATGREQHNSFLEKALAQEQEPAVTVTVIEQMRQRVRSKAGGEIYRKRKQTVEPVFGIIKEVLGFRRFSLRGEQQADGEWSLVCLAYNLKRLFTLNLAK